MINQLKCLHVFAAQALSASFLGWLSAHLSLPNLAKKLIRYSDCVYSQLDRTYPIEARRKARAVRSDRFFSPSIGRYDAINFYASPACSRWNKGGKDGLHAMR